MHHEYLRDKNKTFEYEGDPLELTSLKIWHCKFRTLKELESFKNLRSLVIASFPDESLESLVNLTNLEYLSILHLPKITDFEPLSRLKKLEALSISTLSSWDASRKTIEISSLIPLASLPKLKYLELHGIVTPNKKLNELFSSKSLTAAIFSQYPKSEIERFYKESNVQKKRIPHTALNNQKRAR
jgi:hypothetical protein